MPPDPYPKQFSIIDGKPYTAWTMHDGCVMCGTLEFDGVGVFAVKRVDGGIVRVESGICRPATPDDILAACQFFSDIGKSQAVNKLPKLDKMATIIRRAAWERQAEYEVSEAILKIQRERDLSFGELMRILGNQIASSAKYHIRHERHPGDSGKPGDEE